MFFTGESKTRRVGLGGRSATAAESREQVLERARLQKEERQRRRAEEKGATTIQVSLVEHKGGGIVMR